jgi:integrase
MSKRRAKGEGSITYNSKKDKWQGSYQTPDGKRAYVYANTQRECARKLGELRRKVQSQIDVVSARAALSVFLNHWLAEKQPTWQPKTYTHNEVVCRLHITPHIGHIALDSLDVPTVQRWLRTLREQGSTDTPARALKVLKAALQAAVNWRIIDYNPAALVQAPKHTARRGIALTIPQVDTLLATVAGHRLEALYHIAVTLGLRRGELVELRWADVNWDAATLTVQGGKTPAAHRTLPLDIAYKAGAPTLLTVLRDHWQHQIAERAALPLTWQEHGYMFPSEVGTKLLARNLYRHFKSVLRRAGLPDVCFHDLRHTALTLLAMRKAPPAVVQAIAGQTTPGLALQIYTHVNLDALRAAFG